MVITHAYVSLNCLAIAVPYQYAIDFGRGVMILAEPRLSGARGARAGRVSRAGRRLILEVCADELSGALRACAAVHDLDRLVAKARLGLHRQHVEASAEPLAAVWMMP